MGILFGLLVSTVLLAEAPQSLHVPSLDLSTEWGTEPSSRIQLVPPGCFDGLLLSAARQPARRGQARKGEATVEVWDLAFRDTPRRESFGLYLRTLKERLSKAFAVPPPSHGQIELAEIMFSDPSSPQKLDLTKVKSMQERFNRMPPNGSPVK